MAIRRANNYLMDYEDTGDLTVAEDGISQTSNPLSVKDTIQSMVDSGAFASGNAILVNGTYYQPVYKSTGSGETFEQGPLENVIVYKENENKVGGDVNWYSPSGEFQQLTQQQEVNATKDLMKFAAVAGSMFGVPAGLGEALGLSGATAQAVGQGLLTTGTQLGSGESLGNALKAGLVTGGLTYGTSLLGNTSSNAPSNSLANVDPVELNAAYDAASNMVDSGMSAGQINEQLVSAGYDPNVVTATLEDVSNLIAAQAPATQPSTQPVTQQAVTPSDVVQITAPSTPSAPTLNNVITAIASSPVAPTNEVVVTAKTPEQTAIEAGFPDVNSYNLFGGNLGAYDQARTLAINANKMAVGRQQADLSYDVNNDGKITSADALMILKGTPLRQMETVEVTAPSQPAQQPATLNNVISAISTLPETQSIVTTPPEQLQTVEITAPAQQQLTSQDVVNTIIANQTPELIITDQAPAREETLPETIITSNRPITNERDSSITEEETTPPVIVPSSQIDTTIPSQEKKYTLAELADLARLGLLGAGLIAGSNASSSGPTQYDIVPVPADWKSPVYQKDLPPTAPTQLPPIDFGNRNLLIGTQWEKFLDPNYGKIPESKKFNQPSNMSYDRLMSILGTGIDVMPSKALSINDVISGIQNQYGQKP